MSQHKETNKIDTSVLRVGMPNEHSVDFYEPTRIHFSDEYLFLESIYSTLIHLSDDISSPEASHCKKVQMGRKRASLDYKGRSIHR